MVGSQALHHRERASGRRRGLAGDGGRRAARGVGGGSRSRASRRRRATVTRGPRGPGPGARSCTGARSVSSPEARRPAAAGVAAWGGMAAGRFETRSEGVATEGEVTTGMAGADRHVRSLARRRCALARPGQGLVRVCGGARRGRGRDPPHGPAPLRAGAPRGADVGVGSLAGYGKGELTVTAAGGERVATDLRMRMGAVGARGHRGCGRPRVGASSSPSRPTRCGCG